MAVQEQERLVVRLANMLANKQPNTDSSSELLSLLCKGFEFDVAFLYEADWDQNRLKCTESVGTPAQIQAAPELILPNFCENFSGDTIRYCDQRLQPAPEQIQWMSLFGVPTAVVAYSADEKGQIFSLIVLCCTTQKQIFDEPTRENLEAALTIMLKNITVQIYQNRLRFAQTALEGVLDNTGIDIYVNDFYNHDILYVNESMAKPYGGKVEFANRKCWQVLFPGQTGPCEFCPQSKLIDENGKPTKVYTWDYQRAFDGSWFRVFSAAFRWADGRLAHVVSSADITDNKRNEELIRYMANYDVLTDLPNRRMLVTECEQRINKDQCDLAFILFFDIDGFKNINDSLGHDAGDEFLMELGKFFSQIPLLKNSIYRNGGDEFVAMLGAEITVAHVRDLSRFIQMRFEKPWKLKSGTVTCGISIGVSRYPDDGLTPEELLRKADQAMYGVKKSGGGGMCFADDDSSHS